jgi:hypothetical protein
MGRGHLIWPVIRLHKKAKAFIISINCLFFACFTGKVQGWIRNLGLDCRHHAGLRRCS